MAKEIIGFKLKTINNDYNDICPYCHSRTFFMPIGIEMNEGFLGLKAVRKLEYTCDKCGCIWRTE
jgi:DNA-directed RNA polymerase subunit RPC12/RpoP